MTFIHLTIETNLVSSILAQYFSQLDFQMVSCRFRAHFRVMGTFREEY